MTLRVRSCYSFFHLMKGGCSDEVDAERLNPAFFELQYGHPWDQCALFSVTSGYGKWSRRSFSFDEAYDEKKGWRIFYAQK